ncbi:RND transporter [Actinoplanes sp. SE50]|uniref:efflux RND transporter periplasmic adaptor subunit n=1 Tax=unclassified Actinoplanes TaxID=2626549 RepID=UPI00023ECD19|nr:MULTISPECIES: HlyD family efflux transporter periplasmic adaptor subunit [unclassified Actinoplanes]AEV86019.1 DNA-directed RNA polymerase subunit beta' [Actinoplanes sp. SE50/110]ATO84417.1 RND transporter [Actinoplanes sp. SE50]SLM01827.1 RND transporter [Actinoplanes sp. SE50/110]
MSRTPSRSALITGGTAVLLLLTAASCKDDNAGVHLGTATIGTVDEIVEAPGSVTARGAATLTAPAAGTVTDLRVQPGDRVKKGDVLAVIDSPELRQRRDAARRALAQTPSGGGGGVSAGNFTQVRRSTDRQAGQAFQDALTAADQITDPTLRDALRKQVSAAQQQYRAASAAAASAVRAVQRGVASLGQAVSSLSAAQRLQAQQAYELADAAVRALTLKAPVAGVVQFGGSASPAAPADLSALLQSGGATTGATTTAGGAEGVDTAVTEGSPVTAGAPLLTVVDVGRLGLTAQVDETDVLLVKPGVTADVELDAATGAAYTATVGSVDLLPTTSARGGVSYRVRLDLGDGTYTDGSGAAPTPRPGMSAVIRLRVRQVQQAVTVPASAVVSADGHDTVWAVRDGHYRAVPVRLGVQGEDTVQVQSGLPAGERIVISGADRVHDGAEAP